jgi:hypothetical protein
MAVRVEEVTPVLSQYLETPCFLFKVLIALYVGDEIKELFHLLTEAYVETVQICEASNSEIKMEDVILVGRKELSQEGSLQKENMISLE